MKNIKPGSYDYFNKKYGFEILNLYQLPYPGPKKVIIYPEAVCPICGKNFTSKYTYCSSECGQKARLKGEIE